MASFVTRITLPRASFSGVRKTTRMGDQPNFRMNQFNKLFNKIHQTHKQIEQDRKVRMEELKEQAKTSVKEEMETLKLLGEDMKEVARDDIDMLKNYLKEMQLEDEDTLIVDADVLEENDRFFE